MPLADQEIIKAIEDKSLVIDPFVRQKVKDGSGLSHGLGSFSYDLTLAPTYAVPDEIDGLFQTPRKNKFTLFQAEGYIILNPGAFVLAVVNEFVKMPDDCLGFIYNKSTYARLGINVFTTVVEPAWQGYLTLEISNLNTQHIGLKVGAGICSLVLERGTKPNCTYLGGKYQNQPKEPICPKI